MKKLKIISIIPARSKSKRIKNKNIIKFKKINKKPLFPTKSEVNKNKRARSAKIRIIERLSIGKWRN